MVDLFHVPSLYTNGCIPYTKGNTKYCPVSASLNVVLVATFTH